MIDPKQFITNSPKKFTELKEIEGTFKCYEIGCFEVVTSGSYDPENKKVFWTCPNGHAGEARLAYE